MVEFGKAVAVNARPGTSYKVLTRVHGRVRPRGSVIGKEFIAAVYRLFQPGIYLVVYQFGVFALIYVRAHGDFIVALSQVPAFAHVVVGDIVVYVV